MNSACRSDLLGLSSQLTHQSPPVWQVNSRSCTQDILRVLFTRMVPYRAQNRLVSLPCPKPHEFSPHADTFLCMLCCCDCTCGFIDVHIVVTLLCTFLLWLEYCGIVAVHIVVTLLCTLSCRYCAHFRSFTMHSVIFFLCILSYSYWAYRVSTLYRYCARCPTVTMHAVALLLCTLWYSYCAHCFTITACIHLNIVIMLLYTLWYFCLAHCTVTVHIVILLHCTLLYRHCTHRPIISWTLWYCCCAHWILKDKRTIFQLLNL